MDYSYPKFGAVYHCFCGDVETIKRYCDVGVKYFGIGGKIFYENELKETVRFMPEDSLVLETDAPYIRIPDMKVTKYIAFIMGYCRADSACSRNYNRKNN